MQRDSLTIGDYQTLATKLSNKRAEKYLRFGFNMRALQIRETKFQLSQTIEKGGGKNLSPYDICHVNIFLNSFYLNIFGALDNLAWAMQYEYAIVDGATEANKKRNRISLFGKTFLRGLEKFENGISEPLTAHREWYQDLKKFRDPAAHRMPLYCPPRVVGPKHHKKYASANEKLLKQKYSEDNSSYMDTLHELSMVGEFQPVFRNFTESAEDVYYPILRTVEDDYSPFWEVANVILDLFNKNLAQQVD